MFDLEKIAPDWMPSFDKLKTQKTWTDLDLFVAGERLRSPVYPPHEDVFRAFAETSLTDTKAVLLGQDPYHNENQAHGLAFSVSRGQKLPPSLQNILKELDTDLGIDVGKCGDLTKWARQGVLLLNTVLTVRAHEPGSHRKHGWEFVTDNLIKSVASRETPIAFVLWGADAQAKLPLLAGTHHFVIQDPHPSPLSARKGYFGSRPFSKINAFLVNQGKPPIDWDTSRG